MATITVTHTTRRGVEVLQDGRATMALYGVKRIKTEVVATGTLRGSGRPAVLLKLTINGKDVIWDVVDSRHPVGEAQLMLGPSLVKTRKQGMYLIGRSDVTPALRRR